MFLSNKNTPDFYETISPDYIWCEQHPISMAKPLCRLKRWSNEFETFSDPFKSAVWKVHCVAMCSFVMPWSWQGLWLYCWRRKGLQWVQITDWGWAFHEILRRLRVLRWLCRSTHLYRVSNYNIPMLHFDPDVTFWTTLRHILGQFTSLLALSPFRSYNLWQYQWHISYGKTRKGGNWI